MKEVIDCAAGVFVVRCGKTPAAAVFGVSFDNAHGEILLEAFELARDYNAVRERTEKTNIEVVAVWFDGKLVRSKLVPPGTIRGWIVTLGHGVCTEEGKEV